MISVDDVERTAFAAWPAEEITAVGGWRLRFMNGVSRRGNSVWPGDAPEGPGAGPLADRVARVEDWYAARGLPPMFQIDPRVHPELDAFLGARGYRTEAPVAVQTADPRAVAGGAQPEARVFEHLSDEWFELSAHRGRFARVAPTYRRLLERIGDRAVYALASVDGRPAAVGMGVLSGAMMGVFSMMTVPEARRRGGGLGVLSALAAVALGRGVSQLYLLVERDNAPGLALYAAASFRELYGYHYRLRPLSSS